MSKLGRPVGTTRGQKTRFQFTLPPELAERFLAAYPDKTERAKAIESALELILDILEGKRQIPV